MSSGIGNVVLPNKPMQQTALSFSKEGHCIAVLARFVKRSTAMGWRVVTPQLMGRSVRQRLGSMTRPECLTALVLMSVPSHVAGQQGSRAQCVQTDDGVVAIIADTVDGVHVLGPIQASASTAAFYLNLDPGLLTRWISLASTFVMTTPNTSLTTSSTTATPTLPALSVGQLRMVRYGTSDGWSPNVLLAFQAHTDSTPILVTLTPEQAATLVASLELAATRAAWTPPAARGPGVPIRIDPLRDAQPRRTRRPLPQYPERLRRARVEGWVLLEFVIDERGRVEWNSVEGLCFSHRGFVKPARDAIRKSRYTPVIVNGNPQRAVVFLRIGFAVR